MILLDWNLLTFVQRGLGPAGLAKKTTELTASLVFFSPPTHWVDIQSHISLSVEARVQPTRSSQKCEMWAGGRGSLSRYTDRANFANGLPGLSPTLPTLSLVALRSESCAFRVSLSAWLSLQPLVSEHYAALSLTFASCFLSSDNFLSYSFSVHLPFFWA